MLSKNMTRKLAAFAGGCTLALASIGTSGGCNSIFWANLLKGVGDGAVGGIVGAATAPLGTDFANAANQPLTSALTATYDQYINFMYPVIVDAQVIYKQ